VSLGNAGQFAGAQNPGSYSGMLDQVIILHTPLDAAGVLASVAKPETKPAGAALFCSFDNGDARDDSGHGTNGVMSGVDSGKGMTGTGLWFRSATAIAKGDGKGKAGKGGKAVAADKEGESSTAAKGTFVQKNWETYVPIVTRAMALAGKNLFVSGPPDTLDEEYAFERMAAKDPAIQAELEEHDAALEGMRGAKLWMMNVESGEQGNSLELDSPPVWDGMVIARGRLYVVTVDGQVKCFGK
jgi:hypothetical protein